ncbi:MAG: hypothetical protein ACLGI3_09680 [Actinomycetes bacterium]
MEMYVVRTADNGDLAALRDAAGDRGASAMSRRRAPAHERVRTPFPEVELRPSAAEVDATPPAPSTSERQGASKSTRWDPVGTVVATDSVAAARLGRAFAMQRRRQLCQGKQAVNGDVDRTATAAGAGAPALRVLHGGGG